jgi:diphosphomevalonate decarboxylase
MAPGQATACAHPNIAFIKYWGDRDPELRLPANDSLSMNLAGLETVTTVSFDADLPDDTVTIDGVEAGGLARHRVVAHLDRVRRLAGLEASAQVTSRNNFPAAAGIASSASAFAALSLAACAAAGLRLDERALSRLARLGSGSACRSVPAGFVEWHAGTSDQTSFGYSIAPPEHWDLCDLVAVVSAQPKPVGSREGHGLADTSFLQPARVASVPLRLTACRAALLARDLTTFGLLIEEDALAMHAVMMTSRPSVLYWEPATLAVLRGLREWRAQGLAAYFTIDAGPNVHCLCRRADAPALEARLRAVPGVSEVLVAGPGGGAKLVTA